MWPIGSPNPRIQWRKVAAHLPTLTNWCGSGHAACRRRLLLVTESVLSFVHHVRSRTVTCYSASGAVGSLVDRDTGLAGGSVCQVLNHVDREAEGELACQQDSQAKADRSQVFNMVLKHQDTPEEAQIVIAQNGEAELDEDIVQWSIQISKTSKQGDDTILHDIRTIRDPLSREQHLKIHIYLETSFGSSRAPLNEGEIKGYMDGYATRLAETLSLEALLDEVVTVNKAVEIIIQCSPEYLKHQSKETPSIFSLHWEMLENYKSSNHTSIVVRRCVLSDTLVSPPTSTASTVVEPWLSSTVSRLLERDVFNVLVVVARRGSDSWSPTAITSSLLQVREEIRWGCHSQRLRVYVARPGSLEQLETILRSGIKFEIIHFDTHGIIE